MPQEPLELSISLPGEVFEADAPVPLSLSLRNGYPEPVRIAFRPPMAAFRIRVRQDGEELPLSERGEVLREGALMGQAALLDLDPGEVNRTEVDLAEAFPLGGPGTYTVVAERPVIAPDVEGVTDTIVSNEIRFRIA